MLRLLDLGGESVRPSSSRMESILHIRREGREALAEMDWRSYSKGFTHPGFARVGLATEAGETENPGEEGLASRYSQPSSS